MKKSNNIYSIGNLINSSIEKNLPPRYEIIQEGSYSLLRIINASFIDSATYRNIFPGIKIYDREMEVIGTNIHLFYEFIET